MILNTLVSLYNLENIWNLNRRINLTWNVCQWVKNNVGGGMII